MNTFNFRFNRNLETPRNTFLSLFLLIFLLQPFLSQAQYLGGSATKDANDQLRFLFGQTVQPSANYPALFEMSVHYSNESWWTNYNTDTSNALNFSAIYEELYYALYDTLDMLPIPDYWDPAVEFGSDTVVIGLIDYNFYKLKQDAFGDSTYFYVDTINEQLVDNPNRLSIPYLEKNIFTICAFKEDSRYGDMVYRIDPAFFVIDSYNMSTYYQSSLYDFQIDFGDGNGWVTFDPTVVSHHSVQYPDGATGIRAKITSRENPDDDIKLAAAYKTAPFYEQILIPNYQIWNNIDGLNIAYMPACQISSQNYEEKFLIFLTGIDLTNEMRLAWLANKLKYNKMADLQNYGYSILVVQWKDSKKSLVDNAMHVVELIDYLKCNKLNPSNDIQHPFVVMGESMGGVIGRYALTYMESNSSQSTCFQDLMHNTRLFISQDAPHQGAYVPIAYQVLYKHIMIPTVSSAIEFLAYDEYQKIKKFKGLMEKTAVKQLLSVHVGNSSGGSFNPMVDRTSFLSQLQALSPSTNGWPKHCKKIGITQGLLTGQNQLGSEDACILKAADEYLDLQIDLNHRIFGIPYTGVFGSLKLRRVNQFGIPFLTYTGGVNTWKIQIQWSRYTLGWCPICTRITFPTGFTIGFLSTSLRSLSQSSNNVPDYDIAPGGYAPSDNDLIGMSMPLSNPPLFRWGFSLINNNGSSIDCVDDQVIATRIPGKLGFAYDIHATSKSFRFSFIPTRSALDFNTSYSLDANIYALPTSVKMANTPFDVIMGEFNLYLVKQMYLDDVIHNDGGKNEYHVNPFVYNDSLDIQDSVRIDFKGHWLNREVGDRVLMLENLAMDFPAIIEAEKEIYGGINLNPYYEYPTVSSSMSLDYYNGKGFPNNGIFSDDRPLNTSPYMELVAGAVHDWGIVGSYGVDLTERLVCNYNFSGKNEIITSGNNFDVIKKSINELLLYPNPSNDFVNIQLPNDEDATVNLYSMQGQLLYSKKVQFTKDNPYVLNFDSNLPSGIYMLNVNTQTKTMSNLINIQK